MKRCKFLTLMLALLLLLQSSALAADKGKTVTVTLPTKRYLRFFFIVFLPFRCCPRARRPFWR